MHLAGEVVSIEFEKDGQHHRTVSWSTCKETTDQMFSPEFIPRIKLAYEQMGAEVINITRIEQTEVAVM